MIFLYSSSLCTYKCRLPSCLEWDGITRCALGTPLDQLPQLSDMTMTCAETWHTPSILPIVKYNTLQIDLFTLLEAGLCVNQYSGVKGLYRGMGGYERHGPMVKYDPEYDQAVSERWCKCFGIDGPQRGIRRGTLTPQTLSIFCYCCPKMSPSPYIAIHP